MENLTIIGVIGGVGPHAGLDFVLKIFTNTRAPRDQDHLSCLLISCPSIIPDRTSFLLSDKNGEENPAFGMFESAKRLYGAGVRLATVACNTAHAERIFKPFCAMVQESFPDFVILNMLESCALNIKETQNVRRLGLLATIGTHKSRLYQEYFKEEEGFTLIEPGPEGQEKVHAAILSEEFGIKAHSHDIKPRAKDLLREEITRLCNEGAEAIILGCTELPLAVQAQDFSVPLIDPGLIAARRLITLVAPEKLLP